jgi:hypothetical protein
MGKPTYYDLVQGHPTEVKKKYKLNDRQFEQQVRRHHDGANAVERRDFYESVYNQKRKS